MPHGSGRPDLSQRPRREAPGMLTSFAILERELGSIEYQRHKLEGQLRRRPTPVEAKRMREQLLELEGRRKLVLKQLDDQHEEWGERPAPDGGASLRARSSTRQE